MDPSNDIIPRDKSGEKKTSPEVSKEIEAQGGESPMISVSEATNVSEKSDSHKGTLDSDAERDEIVSKVTEMYNDDDGPEGLSAVNYVKRLSSVEWIFDTSAIDVGAIDLSFPENYNKEFTDVECLPLSYYTLSGKERLLLAFAENFRRQFVVSPHYSGRRPLVLAPKNECGVQKFVCTTIRPTAFLIPSLIGDWKECASFVADFIIYEHLTNPLDLVSSSHYSLFLYFVFGIVFWA